MITGAFTPFSPFLKWQKQPGVSTSKKRKHFSAVAQASQANCATWQVAVREYV